MECQFCKKILKDKYKLATHQKNTKKCLVLQGKTTTFKKEYTCKCRYQAQTQKKLEIHQDSCLFHRVHEKDIVIEDMKSKYLELKNKLNNMTLEIKQTEAKDCKIKDLENKLAEKDKIIAEKDAKIKDLEDKIYEIAKQPRNNTNNTTNTTNVVQNFIKVDDDFNQGLTLFFQEKLTDSDVAGGKKRATDLMINYIKDIQNETGSCVLKVSDHSRGVLKFMDKNGQIVKDVKGYKLFNNTLKPAILPAMDNRIDVYKEAVYKKRELWALRRINEGLKKDIEREKSFLRGIGKEDNRRSWYEHSLNMKYDDYIKNAERANELEEELKTIVIDNFTEEMLVEMHKGRSEFNEDDPAGMYQPLILQLGE